MIEPAASTELAQGEPASQEVVEVTLLEVDVAVVQSQRPEAGVLHAIQSLIYLIVIAVFIITFCVQPFRIPSGSMEPTLLVGDFLLVDKQGIATGDAGLLPSTRIRRGEIIVFHYPVDPSIHLVKRVVGMPGDHLKLRNGRVYINDVLLPESYAVYRPSMPDGYRDNFPRLQNADPNIDSRWWIRMRGLIDDGELIIPADNYFVLGDNRNNSEDSRYWGFVPREAIVGQPLLVYFSVRLPGFDDSDVLPSEAKQRTGTILDSFSNFARWDRVFRVVR
ncbi:signal peptidase I [Edaphobacter aggregans]|uniref:Signal peptidase I n=1 Tax=Edaphobacter aggregans TaxID=570835 RepID=A0A428MLF4_9BACT|nr:signal peptidase I [Edaphobacter aggregans]RSL17725.1 signal peptidase I [Edaphobacter aggregans]